MSRGWDVTDTADGRREINRRMMQVVRHAMQQDGLTRRALEHMTETASPTVSDWFNHGAVPDAGTIAKLARGLHVNAHWLLTGKGPQSPPGEGREKADELFTLGASAVLHDLREILGTLEARWSAAVLAHEDAIRRAGEAVAFVRRENRRTDQTPGRRKSPRRKRTA